MKIDITHLSRRAAVAAVATVGTAPAMAAMPGSPISPNSVRALVDRTRVAVKRECDAEETYGDDDPRYLEAQATAAALEVELDALSEAVWATPPRTWSDARCRAEIARQWFAWDGQGRPIRPDTPCQEKQAIYALVAAVLAVGSSASRNRRKDHPRETPHHVRHHRSQHHCRASPASGLRGDNGCNSKPVD